MDFLHNDPRSIYLRMLFARVKNARMAWAKRYARKF